MANIPVYDSPALSIRPSETGVESVAGAARRIGGFYNQQSTELRQLGRDVGQLGDEQAAALRSVGRGLGSGIQAAGDAAVAYEDHREISAGAAKGTELMAGLTDQWNKTISDPNIDPNNPAIAKQFLSETVEPALEQFQSGFTTEKSQQFAEQFAQRFRQHMTDKTTADMSTLAGIALKANVQTTVNSLSSMVNQDPSSLDNALETVDHTIGAKVGSSPTLDPTTAASVRTEAGLKARESIVKSAVLGMIQKNPNIDLDAIQKKYGDYINGAEMKMFQKSAQVQARVDTATAKQSEILQRQLADQNMHAGSNKILTDNVTIDPQSGQPIINPKFFQETLDLARKNHNAPSAASTVRTMMDWGLSQQNKEAKAVTDPAIASNLDAGMFNLENPTTKIDILRAEADHKLSRADAEIRTKLIDQRDAVPKDPQFKFAMDGAKEMIEGRTSGEKSLQAGKYAAFMQDFFSTYQQQKAAGTLPPNALNLRDPTSLISQKMEAYKSPLAAAVSGNGGVTPPLPPPAASAAAPEPEKPPVEGARKAPDGKWYVQKDGKYFRVNQ